MFVELFSNKLIVPKDNFINPSCEYNITDSHENLMVVIMVID